MRKVLLLEDDSNLGLVLQEHLQMNGFEVTLCANGEEGMATVLREPFDLCLVDIMMPKRDGFSFAREVRSRGQQTPLIFLTAKSLKEDKIEGFRVGCDDYVTKPFSIEELLLRIEAVLRRCQPSANSANAVQFTLGSYSFDYERQTLRCGSTDMRLTPTESELLRLLCMNLNRTLDRDTALRAIWGNETYFSGRSMDVFISKLRKYLKDDPRVEILSIHSKGFKLVVSESRQPEN